MPEARCLGAQAVQQRAQLAPARAGQSGCSRGASRPLVALHALRERDHQDVAAGRVQVRDGGAREIRRLKARPGAIDGERDVQLGQSQVARRQLGGEVGALREAHPVLRPRISQPGDLVEDGARRDRRRQVE